MEKQERKKIDFESVTERCRKSKTMALLSKEEQKIIYTALAAGDEETAKAVTIIFDNEEGSRDLLHKVEQALVEDEVEKIVKVIKRASKLEQLKEAEKKDRKKFKGTEQNLLDKLNKN
jgi:formyltetrahydrofolate synthetase